MLHLGPGFESTRLDSSLILLQRKICLVSSYGGDLHSYMGTLSLGEVFIFREKNVGLSFTDRSYIRECISFNPGLQYGRV